MNSLKKIRIFLKNFKEKFFPTPSVSWQEVERFDELWKQRIKILLSMSGEFSSLAKDQY